MGTWTKWCCDSTATTATTSEWDCWVSYSNTTAAMSTATTDCWIYWNTGGSYGNRATAKWTNPSARELTAEEIERQKKVAEEIAAKRLKEEQEGKAAEERAAILLKEQLDAEQRKTLEEQKKFHVVGSDGQRYEVDATKRTHNVFQLNMAGERVREYCIYQTGGTPQSDHLLAQKLLLEADAEQFKRVANKWDLIQGRRLVAGVA